MTTSPSSPDEKSIAIDATDDVSEKQDEISGSRLYIVSLSLIYMWHHWDTY